LDELLLDAVEEAQSLHPDRNIRLSIEHLPDDPQRITLGGYRQLLMSALGNLIDNALKFSDGRDVECGFRHQDDSNLIWVRDKGIGITEQELKKLYQPFFRAENARGYEGHGIGLALAERIIRLHGGQLKFNSLPGEGTTVKVSFPAIGKF
jgi:signal transduction histidine kinase